MYPYHVKIKQRIANHELIKYEYVDKYKDISPCLLLHFETEPYIRPIRKHRFIFYCLPLTSLEVRNFGKVWIQKRTAIFAVGLACICSNSYTCIIQFKL